MKWAFIDYENIGCLTKVDLSVYERVIVFAGAKQPKIDFGDKKYESPLNITLIQIKATQANNLDFHLSYYLGLFSAQASSNVSFEVITNDNGFGPLICHIKANGRACKQVKMANSAGDLNKLIHSLESKPKEKRPRKITSLKNHIASHMKAKGNDVAIQNYVNQLVNQKFLTLSNTGVLYNR